MTTFNGAINVPAGQPPANVEKHLPRLHRFAGLMDDLEADATAIHEARLSGQPRGPITGLKKVDAELGGALPPGLTMLMGNTGTGKTALSLQTAADCKCPSLYVSCEMSPLELFRRHIANATGTYLGRLKSGEMRPETVMSLARQAAEAAPLLSVVDATRAAAAPAYLRDVAEEVKGDSRHLLIVVDSLHSWAEAAVQEGTEYDALNAGLAQLRTLAHQLVCALLVVCERNRQNIKSDSVNAGAGTRRIEYGAEVVIALDRKEDAREDGAGDVDVVLKFAKNRNGAAGKPVALKFNGALQRFREADR
jgi:replicative DNA helicase